MLSDCTTENNGNTRCRNCAGGEKGSVGETIPVTGITPKE
jgi:hypothetical protein